MLAKGRSEQPMTCRWVGSVTHVSCGRSVFRGWGRRVYQECLLSLKKQCDPAASVPKDLC